MSSYREDRGNRRSRSRSRDRRDAPRDNRDKGDRDRNDRDRADRDRDTRNDRDSRVDRDRNDRDRTDRDREDVRPKEKKLTRSELEALKRERVALVKRLTHGDDSDDEGKGKGKEVEVEGDGLQDVDNSEAEIAKLLGFGGFSSTKGTQVSDNKDGAASGAVSKHKERKYRQYMNRKAGFNRPLQAMP